MLLKNNEIFYMSNILSLSRFVLLIPASFFIISEGQYHFLVASSFIVLLWLTDVLDGYFARKRNEISGIGKIIDPLADKVSVAVITLLLLLKGILPLWFFAAIVLRDLIILSGGLYVKKKYSVVLQSNWVGKLTAFVIGFTLLNSLLIHGFIADFENNFFSYHIEKLELYWKVLILISIAMTVFSLVSYSAKFLKITSNKKFDEPIGG